MRRHGMKVGAGLVLSVAVLLTACSGTGSKTPAITGGPSASGSWSTITPVQLHDMMAKENLYLVNVHVPYEGEIRGTDAFVPYTDIAHQLNKLPFGKQPVVIYCRTGNMSSEAAQAMVQAGAPPFYELSGGFYAWQDAGYPLQSDHS